MIIIIFTIPLHHLCIDLYNINNQIYFSPIRRLIVLQELPERELRKRQTLVNRVQNSHSSVNTVKRALEIMVLCHLLSDFVRILISHPTRIH